MDRRLIHCLSGTTAPFDRRDFLRGAALSLLGLTVFGVSSPVAFAATASPETLAALDAAQAEYDDAVAELARIGDELEEADYRLGECQANLDETNRQIEDLEASIDQKQLELAEAQDILADRIKANYMAGTTEMLDVLLSATSFEDFESRLYYANKVSDADSQAIQDVKDIKAELEAEEAELEVQRAEQEDLLAQQQAITDELEQTKAYYESYVANLSAEVTELMQRAQEELIAAQQAEYEAYLARVAAEEAAAAQAEAEAAAAAQAQAEATAAAAASASSGGGESSGGDSYVSENTYTPSAPAASSSSSSSSSSSGSSYFGGNHVPAVASIAWNYIGVPYVYGGSSPSGFDCSGLTQYCYAQAGYTIGRDTYAQAANITSHGQMVYSMSSLQPGDLVFPHSGHVGIYEGDGMMIHAPTPGDYVKYASVYAFSFGGCPV